MFDSEVIGLWNVFLVILQKTSSEKKMFFLLFGKLIQHFCLNIKKDRTVVLHKNDD